jgi:hypothetical protein
MMVLTYLDHLENNPMIYKTNDTIDVVGLPSLKVALIEPWRDQDTGAPARSFASPDQIPYITYEYNGEVETVDGVVDGRWYIKLDIIKDGFLVVV